MKDRDEQVIHLYQGVCDCCSELFESEDEEMTLCSKCWNNYLQNQLKSQTCIRLTKEYLDQLSSELTD